jgi:hypothetical protein
MPRDVTIYGLADPDTSVIRYVGRTQQPVKVRFKQHIANARRKDTPVYSWIRSLQPKLPLLIVLEEGIVEKFIAANTIKVSTGLHWTTGQHAETKWMKRFEKSQLLCEIPRGSHSYKWLVNPPQSKPSKKGTR